MSTGDLLFKEMIRNRLLELKIYHPKITLFQQGFTVETSFDMLNLSHIELVSNSIISINPESFALADVEIYGNLDVRLDVKFRLEYI